MGRIINKLKKKRKKKDVLKCFTIKKTDFYLQTSKPGILLTSKIGGNVPDVFSRKIVAGLCHYIYMFSSVHPPGCHRDVVPLTCFALLHRSALSAR